MSSAQVVSRSVDDAGQYEGKRYGLQQAHQGYGFLSKCFFHQLVNKVSSKNSVSRKLRLMVCTDRLLLQLTETGGAERVIQLEHIQKVKLQAKPGKNHEILIMLNTAATTDPDMHFVMLQSPKNVPAGAVPSEICQIIKYLVWCSTGRVIPLEFVPATQDIAAGARKQKPPSYARPEDKLRSWHRNPEAANSPYRGELLNTFKKNLNPYEGMDEVKLAVKKDINEPCGVTLTTTMRVSRVLPNSIVGRATSGRLAGRYLTHVDGDEVRDMATMSERLRGLREVTLTFSKNPLPEAVEKPVEQKPAKVEEEACLVTVSQQAGSGDINEPPEEVEEVPRQRAQQEAGYDDALMRNQMLLYQMMLAQRMGQAQRAQPITVNLKLNFIRNDSDSEDGGYHPVATSPPVSQHSPGRGLSLSPSLMSPQHFQYPYTVSPALNDPVYNPHMYFNARLP